ncbi:MAG: serine/threonine-protein kinase [Acidobacteriota bacterium]
MPPAILADGPTESFPNRVEIAPGAGAMGIVYRATDVALARPVAIKVMKVDVEESPELKGEERRRFLQEARAAAALTHPGVTTVHRIGKIGGAPYIVMEWLEGKTLQAIVKDDGARPLEQALRWVYELLDVLSYAHGYGVVHRDIKPANLVIVEGGRLKVTDFGLAVHRGRELVKTAAGSVMATPQYASPEQLDGQKVDHRTDLFSTAVVFYNLLTGAMPWEGKNLTELFAALFSKPPIPVLQRMSGLPAALEPWFARALARNRDERFASADEMAAQLRQALEPPKTSRSGMTQTLIKTEIMTAPEVSFVAAGASRPWEGVLALVQSWPAQELGVVECSIFLDKLLDTPLHVPPFAGAAFFGDLCLLVEGGVIFAAVRAQDGAVLAEADLPSRGEVRLHSTPANFQPGTITLLASALQSGPARHRGLDSLVVNLPAFTGRLLAKGFEGVFRLEESGCFALYLLLTGRSALALVGGSWPQDPRQVGWENWLSSVEATASFFDRYVRPPSFWYRRGFRQLEWKVERLAELPQGSSTATLAALLGSGAQESQRLLRAQLAEPSRERVGSVQAASAPMSRFLEWMLQVLPQLMVQQRRSDAWKYLADWLLLIDRAWLHVDVERPSSGKSDYFDLMTSDTDGKVLHLARRIETVDGEGFNRFLDRVLAAKEARRKRGDIGGVFLISQHFSESVLDAYRASLHRGLGNRLLGIDKSMGYDGFVRTGSRRGFHLLLVEERDGGFQPRFVE